MSLKISDICIQLIRSILLTILRNGWKILLVLLLLPSFIPRNAFASEKTKTMVVNNFGPEYLTLRNLNF
jgi:hypothetical protein